VTHVSAIGRKGSGVCMGIKKAENKTSNGNGGGRVKFRYADAERYVDLDMENANAEVADGIKSLANALSGRTIITPVRALAAPKVAVAPPVPPVVDQEEIQFPPQGEDEHEVEEEEADSEPPSNGNGSGQKRSYNFKAPTFLNDLDLSKGTKPLSEFIEAKDPTDVMDKYLVVAFWLQKYMSVEEVTVDHIYTVFDHLGWKGEMPVKPGKPLADLKSKRHVLTREQGAAGYKLNFKGEQYVENMGAKK
jgi:hypothetical protein